MQYFTSFSTSDLVKIISSTKKFLYLCVPSIHEEIQSAITHLNHSNSDKEPKVSIHILLDFDAQTFRQGYGRFESVEKLIQDGINTKYLKTNRVSFILSDDIGYYLFIESRSLVPADKETINAVRIDPVSIVRLKKFFFPEAEDFDFNKELGDAIIEESKILNKPEDLMPEISAQIKEITEDKINNIKTDLEKNPPLDPDYKRLVEFYSNKFQYVKLNFEGANLNHQKVKIPPKALPITDTTLIKQLETKLNLFAKDQKQEEFKPLNTFNQNIIAIREKYLTTIKSRKESLLAKQDKAKFINEVEKLESEIESVQKKIISNISTLIAETKKRLLTDLKEFFIENPKAILPDQQNLLKNDQNYIKQEADSIANEIIYRIKWPKAYELVNKLKLVIQYSDITFEDLQNEEFNKELFDKGLISENNKEELASFGKAIQLKGESLKKNKFATAGLS